MGSLDADLDEAMRQAMGLAPSKANAEPMAIALATPMGRRAKAGLDAELDEAMRQAAGLPPTIKAQPGVAFSQDGGTDLISPETAAQSSPVSRSDFERTLRITLFGADVKGSPEQEKSLNAIVSRRREEDARKQEKEALVSRIDQHVRAALARRRAEGGITGFSDAEIDAIAQAAAEASIATERTQAIRNVAQRTGMSVANLEKLLQRSREMRPNVAASLRRVCPSGSGLILASHSSSSAPVSAEQTEGGQPVRRFRKELIKVGQYIKQADGLQFTVDRPMLDHWAMIFSQMKVNGVKVPVPSGHTNDSEKNRGWVEDIFRDGDSLFGIVALVGDGIRLAGTNDVSIYSQSEYTDGNGNRYQWPILHVALCTDPVVPGLRGFEALAASIAACRR